MSIKSRAFPYGAIPYDNVSPAAKMQAKLFEQSPYLPLLTNIDPSDSLLKRTLLNIPGMVFDKSGVNFNSSVKGYKSSLVKLDGAFNKPDGKHLAPYAIESVFMEKYIALINKFKPANAYINLLGPFSLSQILKSSDNEQLLLEKSYRKLFIQSICVKTLWIAQEIRKINPTTIPVLVLEEPKAGIFGSIRRENEDITPNLVVHIYERIVEKLHSEGILIAVHSSEKCDWTIPINAGVDMISFDAYNNPNNLCIIPEVVTNFLERGGRINWAIVPVTTEALVKSLNIEYITDRYKVTLLNLVNSGVPLELLLKSAMVSIQGDVSKLPLIFAEKAIMLSTQLAGRISSLTF